VGTYPSGNFPADLAFDGDHLWVANQGDGTVSKLDPVTGTVLGSFHAAGSNRLIYDGSNMWVLGFTQGTVTQIRVR
jgi:DNA-binding beta-propeller fold protein YncE